MNRSKHYPPSVHWLAGVKKQQFIVAGDAGAMVCDDLLIGLPVLQHLTVDAKTLLKANIHALDKTEGSLTKTPSSMGKLGRLMTARLDRQYDDDTRTVADRPRVNYFEVRLEEDPFLYPSLLNPIDEDQHNDMQGS